MTVERLTIAAKNIQRAFDILLRTPTKVREWSLAPPQEGDRRRTVTLQNIVLKYLSLLAPSDPPLNVSPIVRQADTNDLSGLAEVLTESFHPSHEYLWWMTPLLKLGIHEDLRQRLRSNAPHYACLVASVVPSASSTPEQVVGTVEIASRTVNWSTSTQTLYISNLAVKASYRRQGIAQSLLLKCDQLARQWGFGKLSLHVLENNHQARQLYTKSGYQLERVESSLGTWLLKQPRRLLLSKHMTSDASEMTSTL